MTNSLILKIEDGGFVFNKVAIEFAKESFENLFAKKNNKTVFETLSNKRYANLVRQ